MRLWAQAASRRDSSTTLGMTRERGGLVEMTEGVDDNFVNDKIKKRMIRIKWTMVAKVLKLTATIITTIVGTLAVQSCAALL